MFEEIIDKQDISYIGNVMTNFDHSIDKELEDKLKQNDCWGEYTAWDFCGYVTYKNEKFICEIWSYHVLVNIIEASTLEEIMKEASNTHGWQ